MESNMVRKTLIINGSPRKNGDTVSLLKVLTATLTGEFIRVDCYSADISPCIDCRSCWKEMRCVLDDDMQNIYQHINNCDNVVIASPIYYSELTGKLLDMASRFQIYYAAKAFRNEAIGIKPKKGGVILVGGGDGKPERAFTTAKILFRQLNVIDIFPLICSHKTNILPAAMDNAAIDGVERLAAFLND